MADWIPVWNDPEVTELYFAYGSNMSTARLGERVQGARRVCVAHLSGWRLAFNKPGRDGSGKANLVPCQGELAYGVVWSIALDDWCHLDRFEPGYARTPLPVHDETGGIHETQLYLHAARGPDIAPHPWYIQHLIDGAREHGLPNAYAHALRTVRKCEPG